MGIGNNKKNQEQQFFLQQGSSQSESTNDQQFKRILWGIFIIVLIVILILIHINQYVQLSRKNLKVEKLKEKRNRLKSENAHLQLKISNLMSLERIEEVAKEELGMKEPDQVHYVVLDNEQKKSSQQASSKEKKQANNRSQQNITDKIMAWIDNLANVQADTLE
ncbi:hypothetical protein JCM16358_22440 [Halanaerocella petrolearia]